MIKNIFFIGVFSLSFYSCADSLTDEQNDFLEYLNEFRKDNNLDSVNYSVALNDAAERHSKDMSEEDFLSHTGSDGSKFDERITDAGYFGSPIMENVAYNMSGEAKAFFEQWENSSDHNENMKRATVQEIGFSVVCKDNKCYATLVGGSGSL